MQLKSFLYYYIKIYLYNNIFICNIFKYKNIFMFLILTIVLHDDCFARNTVNIAADISTNDTKLSIENLQKIAFQNDVPLWALLGILATEKGKNGEALKNANGTWDLGIFQINTIHLNELYKLGIEPQKILSNGNVNAAVAGWLLGKHYRKQNEIWEAIGNYHSMTPSFKGKYIKAVKKNIELLLSKKNVTSLIDYVNRG